MTPCNLSLNILGFESRLKLLLLLPTARSSSLFTASLFPYSFLFSCLLFGCLFTNRRDVINRQFNIPPNGKRPSNVCPLYSVFGFAIQMTVGRKKPKVDHPAPVVDTTKNLPFDDYFLVISLTIIATIVRLYKINYPTSVVFDEVHFGGFASR